MPASMAACLRTRSVEEAHEYIGAMHQHGLDTVFLAAPTSTERRLKLVAQYSTGFVYLVSRTGVTGERDSLSGAVAPLVNAMRAITDLPLAVGFGISRPEHVAQVAAQADAVVVGSALVRVIEKHAGSPHLAQRTGIFRPPVAYRIRSARMTPEEARTQLEEYRVAIDEIDRRLVALLNERTEIVECIGRVKRESAAARI